MDLSAESEAFMCQDDHYSSNPWAESLDVVSLSFTIAARADYARTRPSVRTSQQEPMHDALRERSGADLTT